MQVPRPHPTHNWTKDTVNKTADVLPTAVSNVSLQILSCEKTNLSHFSHKFLCGFFKINRFLLYVLLSIDIGFGVEAFFLTVNSTRRGVIRIRTVAETKSYKSSITVLTHFRYSSIPLRRSPNFYAMCKVWP